MAVLTEAQKVFIVSRLACFDTPTMVARALKEEFGVEAPRNQIALYDPMKAVSGRTIGKQYRQLFDSTRKRFLKSVAEIPVANKAVRLRLLNDAVYAAIEKKNIAQAAALIEQAAKEAGEAFTNKSVIQHKGLNAQTITDQDLVNRLGKFGIAARLPGTTTPGGSDAGG